MRRILRVFAVASWLGLVALTPVLQGQEAHRPEEPVQRERTRYLTNAEVVRMVKAGVEEEAIIASIQSSRCRFVLSPEALLDLHKDGVNEKVLQAMIEADSGNRKPAERGQEAAKLKANKKRPPTPEQMKLLLAKVRAKHSKRAPIKSAPKLEDTDQRVASLKQQKQAVKSGQVVSANSGPSGPSAPHVGVSGSGGGKSGGTLLASGNNPPSSGQTAPRAGSSGSGGGTGNPGSGLLAGNNNPAGGLQGATHSSTSGAGGTGRGNPGGVTLLGGNNPPSGGSSPPAGTPSATGKSGNNPSGGGTLLGSNNPPGGGSTPPAGTPGAAGSGTGGNNPFGGSNPPGGSNPSGSNNPTGGNNPNNPAGGGSTPPARGGQSSGPRTVGTSSRIVSNATMMSNAPVMTAAPASSNPPSPSSMLLSNTQTSIDACMASNMGPIIKGLNSSGSYGPAVFTQNPTYNPFWVIGCHFGNSPGSAYLNSSNGQLLANLTINSWTDTLVKVSLDPSLVDVFDQEDVTLVIVPPSGPSGQKGGFSFYAMRKEVYLTSMPHGRIVPAYIVDDGGVQVMGIVTSPYQGFGFDVAVQAGGDEWQIQPTVGQNYIDTYNAGLTTSGKGWTVGADRNSVYRFGGGTDTFDFSHLKPGFVVSRYQLQQYNAPFCGQGASLIVGDETDYYDGNWNAQLDSTLQEITVSFQEEHCHVGGGSDSSNSAYALNVWVVGPAIPASESPWTPGLN